MNSIYVDDSLRQALYQLYVATFEVLKGFPKAFDNNHATRMLTSLMGSRPWSWRVVGITPEALKLFAAHGFEKPTRQIQRGHLHGRADTARHLFARETPFELGEFFDVFLERDKTVLMLTTQNPARSKRDFPGYIKFDSDVQIFPCASLVGWRHQEEEKRFLRELYNKHCANEL